MQQIPFDFAVAAQPTLDNFVIGANQEVMTTLRAWLRGELREPCICLWGVPGSGRTHLLRAAIACAQESHVAARYVSDAAALVTLDRHAVKLLAIDAIEALDASAQACLFSLLNAASAGELRLLLAADNAPVALPLRDDVRTRVALGLVLQVKLLDDEQKRQALAAHAHACSFELPREVIDYLLVHGQRDMRSLIAVLDAADRYSLQTKRPVSLTLVREVLERSRAAAALRDPHSPDE